MEVAVKGKERETSIVGQYGKDHINCAKNLSFSGCLLADHAPMTMMVPCNIDITNGIEELIEDFTFALGPRTLIKLDQDGPCIAYLIQFEVLPDLYGNRGFLFSKKIDPNRRIDKNFIGHGDSSPTCRRSQACLRAPESFLFS